MTVHELRVRADTYIDSVLLMTSARAMQDLAGVEWATALMGTEANRETLVAEGFADPAVRSARANDVILAVAAQSAEEAASALEAGWRALSGTVSRKEEPSKVRAARTVGEAAARLPGANTAIVSVPGAYAALEAHKALSAGLHVLLFSDNVALDEEVELKRRGEALGLLVMGPGAGTALLGGVGLGFANAVRRGTVGVVAAAGTGAQELMSLVHQGGAGLAAVVGVGGRDLTDQVGGVMARSAIRALYSDPGVEVVVVVSKPPSPPVAAALLPELGAKPTVVALVGLEEVPDAPRGVRIARTLEDAARLAIGELGLPWPDLVNGLRERVAGVSERLPAGRRAVRGLFSGGTLCYESMVLLSSRLGPVRSNVPLRPEWSLPGPPGGHVCLDLGEEEYTRGRPHPMIDPEARCEPIVGEGADPDTAVVLIDVVLGYGAHDDPASILAPACAEVTSRAGAPAVVAYVLGTDADPQGLEGQRRRLEQEGGCLVAPTGARAALMAAAIASRRPATVGERP